MTAVPAPLIGGMLDSLLRWEATFFDMGVVRELLIRETCEGAGAVA